MREKTSKKGSFNKYKLGIAVLILGLGAAGIVQATLMDGFGVRDTPPAVIAGDASGTVNTGQQAFNERQEVTLGIDVRCSSTTVSGVDSILEGEVVNSHMIFYNPSNRGYLEEKDKTWAFDNEIICVMAESSGLYQGLTDGIFAVSGTNYNAGGFQFRGLESNSIDSYTINGNEITVTMTTGTETTEEGIVDPGDWIRVLTKVPVSSDDNPPSVFCEKGVNPGGKNNENKGQGEGSDVSNFFTLIGTDETDGAVEIFLTDDESEVKFGPFEAGTKIKLVVAKGTTPTQESVKGEVDYMIKVNGGTTISATDTDDNTGTAVCSD